MKSKCIALISAVSLSLSIGIALARQYVTVFLILAGISREQGMKVEQ